MRRQRSPVDAIGPRCRRDAAHANQVDLDVLQVVAAGIVDVQPASDGCLHFTRYRHPGWRDDELGTRDLGLVLDRESDFVLILNRDRPHRPPVAQGHGVEAERHDARFALRHDGRLAGQRVMPVGVDPVIVRADGDVLEQRDAVTA